MRCKRNIHWWRDSSFLGICVSKCSICTDTSISPPEPCPCLFSDPQCGGGAQSICGTHFLSQSPAFLFQVFIRLKSRATHCFPLTFGREQKRIKKENKGRWLSNYKQLTRLMHCVVQNKGQYPESCIFLNKGNAKGISVELPLKDKTESGLTKKRKKTKKKTHTYLLMN